MSGPMYFNPTLEQVDASRASNCPMATPKDPSNCTGSRCGSWNAAENKPCAGYRANSDTNAVSRAAVAKATGETS